MQKGKLLAIGAIVTVSLVGTLLTAVTTSNAAGSCSGTSKSSKITYGTVTLYWNANSRVACAIMTRSSGAVGGTSVSLTYPLADGKKRTITDSDMSNPRYKSYAGPVSIRVTAGGTISAIGKRALKKGGTTYSTERVSISVKAGQPKKSGSKYPTTAQWDKVAKCESGGNWSINTGNGYYGGLQFSASTWKAFGGTKYAATANKASKAQQIAIANKVWKGQGKGAWPTCGVGLPNR